MAHYKFIGVTGHRDLNVNMINSYSKAISEKLSTLKKNMEIFSYYQLLQMELIDL